MERQMFGAGRSRSRSRESGGNDWSRPLLLSLAICALAQPTQTMAQDVAVAEAPPTEYSLLTPALESEYEVYTAWALIDVITSHVNTAKSRALRSAVKKDKFNASERLAIALQDALIEAGFPTNIEFVQRPPDGKVRGLSRGDLPEDPRGRYMINLTIRGIGLGASGDLSDWHPYLALTWQLYTREGQPIGLPHKYQQIPGYGKVNEKSESTIDCELPDFTELVKEAAPLWACFDKAFSEASRAMVPEIRAATPGAAMPAAATQKASSAN